ncbi:gluconate 2-dehydrogenase subunit 3 family protein [Hoyosella sp. YIM 151337]|uniref:gluconate 2-dehydrogenase subunit 3 family protein n=1 Tax=Hoyosella sp. YIM 151337 TaxID=2992742 RepID=UPI0022359AD7|nr:gluconate 2-dehydrogenase subunit 3 family protein [Hoyosella sp. YIM 151337]MCW4354070.1 gluconate 2-dehydrogenase subunit 3 family protein [Hoyosella sp. YIM 151337]
MADNRLAQPAEESIALTYLNDAEARTVEVIAERIIPDGGDGAGATQAGVVYYIDRALSGVSQNLQHVYRTGLRALAKYCAAAHAAEFADLPVDIQDEVIQRFLGPAVLEEGSTPIMHGDEAGEHGESADLPTLRRLFAVVREHAIEGFFCDPAYGGNRNAVGWKLVGFPGAYWGYTAEQMGRGFDGRSLPIMTLSDLRTQLRTKNLPDNATFYRNEEN